VKAVYLLKKVQCNYNTTPSSLYSFSVVSLSINAYKRPNLMLNGKAISM